MNEKQAKRLRQKMGYKPVYQKQKYRVIARNKGNGDQYLCDGLRRVYRLTKRSVQREAK